MILVCLTVRRGRSRPSAGDSIQLIEKMATISIWVWIMLSRICGWIGRYSLPVCYTGMCKEFASNLKITVVTLETWRWLIMECTSRCIQVWLWRLYSGSVCVVNVRWITECHCYEKHPRHSTITDATFQLLHRFIIRYEGFNEWIHSKDRLSIKD